jgi:uncharacterized membrane protein HdeD (DUF308 family)
MAADLNNHHRVTLQKIFSHPLSGNVEWRQVITGILLILLALWVSGSDRVNALAQRTYLILFWVGFLALFRGFSQIMLAFTIRHAGGHRSCRPTRWQVSVRRRGSRRDASP